MQLHFEKLLFFNIVEYPLQVFFLIWIFWKMFHVLGLKVLDQVKLWY